MAFHEVLFPVDLSYGSAGGPKFKTTIFTADSGYEQRNIDWSNSRAEYDVAHSIKDQSAMDVLTAFFMARHGRENAFRFLDWNDYLLEDQVIALGDGVTTVFQMVKTYTSQETASGETYTYTRRILKPAWDSVEGVRIAGVLMDEADYSIDYNTGKITFVDPPYDGEAISIDAAEFHVPVRFDAEHLDVQQEFWNTASWPNIEIVEVRLPESAVTVSQSSASAFHEVLLPTNHAYGSSGGPKFKTGVFTADSGFESVVPDWSQVRGEWDISHTVKSPDQMAELTAFFYNRRGRAYGFRFRDWNDYKLRQEVIGYGDDANTTFQVTKTYTSGQVEAGESWTYVRDIKKIAWDTLAGLTLAGDIITQHDGVPSYPDGANYYTVDESTGKITFRFAPAGPRYPTAAPDTAIDYKTSGEGGIFGAFLSNTPTGAGGCFVDWTNGYAYRLGQTPENGLRRIRLSDGVEDYQVTGTTLGLPAAILSLVAIGPTGAVYLQVGTGQDGQAMCRLDLNSAHHLELSETFGVLGPTPAPFPSVGSPGAVSNDGQTVINVPLYNSGDIVVVDADSLEVVRSVDIGTISASTVAAVCPLYDSAFAILTNQTGAVALYDDAGNRLLNLRATGAGANWCVWDSGAFPGVVFGWHDDNGYYVSKYSPETQTELWRCSSPSFAGGHISGQSQVADLLVWKAQDATYYLNTAEGTLRSRAVTQLIPPLAEDQAFSVETMQIVAYATVSSVDAIIDVEISSGDEPLPAAEIKVGYCEFHVPVRFDTDHLSVSQDFWNTSSWPSIPIVEVRDWTEITL